MRGVTCPKCRGSFWVIIRADPWPGGPGVFEQIINCWHCDHVFTIRV